ncbi:hypothetical protein JOC59_001248 [Weissella beninensis]|uniref:Cell division protein FtsL n=1 Tax=Periweissella beninensis TaxID=504936 RepID=A0ABT0VJM0_9LACO|nr:hypothetical protein [Periweissella beninensis]MBM7544531.1 hypothetical protein [Periweissella beninensis]MCM2438029.1 hypothetical protein [Periweissella beninensis]
MQYWQSKIKKSKQPAFILLATLSFLMLLGSVQVWQLKIYEQQMVIYNKVIKSYQKKIAKNKQKLKILDKQE